MLLWQRIKYERKTIMEVLTIGIFCALLIICIITGKSILYALLAGLIIFSLYGKKQGYSWRQISRMALQGAWKVKNILLTFILIGMLTALWIVWSQSWQELLLVRQLRLVLYVQRWLLHLEFLHGWPVVQFFPGYISEIVVLLFRQVHFWWPSWRRQVSIQI